LEQLIFRITGDALQRSIDTKDLALQGSQTNAQRRAIEQRVDLSPGILQLMGAFDDHRLQFALLVHGIAPLAGKDSREHARAQ
jgi:hypothetical protein